MDTAACFAAISTAIQNEDVRTARQGLEQYNRWRVSNPGQESEDVSLKAGLLWNRFYALCDRRARIGQQCRDLEEWMDRYGLVPILENLRDICHAKAEHLETQWQDRTSARLYTATAKRLDSVLASNQVRALPSAPRPIDQP